MPSKQNIVRRLNFCTWTSQADKWIDMGIWDEGAHPVEIEQLGGRPCFGGLDHSSVSDLSAFVLVFPPQQKDELWKVLCRFWIPSANVAKRVQKDRVPYDVWISNGFAEATDGNVIDYGALRECIKEDGSRFALRQIAYDRWNATQLSTQLTEDGFEMIPFGQGYGSMAGAMREVEKLIIGRQIAHAGHPVLRWNMSNVSIAQDPAGNQKPDKSKSTERIDGVVSLVMAGGRAVLHQDPPEPQYQVFFVGGNR